MDLKYAPGYSSTLPFEFHGNFLWHDRWEAWIVAEDDEWFYMITRGVRNQLVMTSKVPDAPGVPIYGWSYGWMFSSFPAAVAAVSNWDPATQDEPADWVRRQTHFTRTRKAPRREEDPDYNRPRCRHGSYMDEPCRIDPMYCATSDESGVPEWEAAGRPAMW